MKKLYYITDLEQLKALSDPLRVNILTYLGTKPKNSMELATALDIPRTRIHYHLKIMEEMGFIEVVDTDIVNGIVQKYYLPTAQAFVPDANIFHQLLNNESKVFSIPKDQETLFEKDLEQLIQKYKASSDNSQTLTYNLQKISK